MKHGPETLVILSPGFAADEADTTCMPPQQVFVKAIREQSPEIHIVVISFHYPFEPGEYQWHGVKVIALGGKDKGGLFRRITWLKAWNQLRKLHGERHLIGLLSFWFGECALVSSCFAKCYKLNHYSWILGQDAKKGNKYFRLIKPKANQLIALSDFIANEVELNYHLRPLKVIPVGIDTALFTRNAADRDIDILGAGSLTELKQYHLFVEAISTIKTVSPQVSAVICGKGPEMEKLKALAMALGLQHNLVLAGELPHNEILALMQRSRVFLHPSAYEGFGSVLSEALYAGAHVVSFCQPMTKNFEHHHVVNSQAELVAELLSVLSNTETTHNPILMFPIEQTAEQIISLFTD